MVSQPPSSGPSAAVPPMVEPQTANAMPCSRPVKVALSSYSEVGRIIAPPMPCRARPAISSAGSPTSAQSTLAAVKVSTPIRNSRRRPDRSAVRPATSSSTPGGLGPSALGRRLGIRSASATALVDRLESAGHVRRVPHPSDRLRQTVTATEAGTDDVLGALRPLIDRVEDAAATLSAAEATAAIRFLAQVAEAMRDYAQEA